MAGVGALLRRKGFTVSKTDWQPFSSMGCMDLIISHGNVSVRLITVYTLQPSKKNQEASPNIFFREFSSLLETVSITPGYLLLTGDYNFHMELLDDTHASMHRSPKLSISLLIRNTIVSDKTKIREFVVCMGDYLSNNMSLK